MRRTHGSEGAPVRQRTGATRLGDDGMRGDQADAGDLIELGYRRSERGDLLLDPRVEGGDIGGDRIDTADHLPQQERVMAGEITGERLLQHRDLLAHGAPGQLRQRLGVTLPGDQRGQHVPPRGPEDVRDHDGKLDLGVLQQLLHPVLLRGAGGDQVGAVAGQVPQLADRRRRHEARPDHLPLGDLAQPGRVELVSLRAAGQVLDVLGVDQPGLEPGRLQQVKHRLPVVAGCLHHHPGHPQARQPVSHAQQRPGHRGIALHLLQPPPRPVLIGHPHATHQLGLADIQRRHPRDDLFVVLCPGQHLACLLASITGTAAARGSEGHG